MRSPGLLLLCISFAGRLFSEPVSQPPARVVTSYALTSAQDFWAEDYPCGWTLLASNDGQSWDVLDTRADQQTEDIPCCRKVFHISNQKAYRIYRLRIDTKDESASRKVSLSEIELLGPVIGVTNEADLQARITSSQEYPLLGAAMNAFDGDTGTKWTDLGFNHPGGCWIQCEYIPQSETLMTNIYQAQLLAQMTATRSLLLERAPQIISNLNVSAAQPSRTLVGYALTSANDAPYRDPRNWQLLGSKDGGKSWDVLDTRHNEIFSARFRRRVFTLDKPAGYPLYRLQIEIGQPGDELQVAEVEPLYADKQDDRRFSLVVSASSEHPPMEKADMAFDDNPRSKWLAFSKANDRFVWIQWQCLTEVEGLPLINQDRLDQLANRGRPSSQVPPLETLSRTLTEYSLTSANDFPDRDPRDWRLLGSSDGGATWKTLDERHNQVFDQRFQKLLFTVSKPAACALYRLEFDSVASPVSPNPKMPTNSNLIQLADIEASYADKLANDWFSIIVLAQGDNALREPVENVFDGEPKTKWLDPTYRINGASWVQWYFAHKQNQRVIRADSVMGTQPGTASVLKLQLQGVAVYAASNLLGFLDESGFQMFQIESSSNAVQPGQRLQLTGRLQFGRGFPHIDDPGLTILAPLTNIGDLRPDQPFDHQRHFAFGYAEGSVTAVSEGPVCTTVQLSPGTGSRILLARILNPEHKAFPFLTGSRLRVRGVIESVFDDCGDQFPGTVWVADLTDVSLTASSETTRLASSRPGGPATNPVAPLAATNQLTSIHQIYEALKNEPGKVFSVKVRGVVTYIDLGLTTWYLQNGEDSIAVPQSESGLSPFSHLEGMYVEVEGTVGSNGNALISPSSFVKVLGKGRMPQPLQHSFDYLMTGNDGGKWVQLQGVITAFEKQRLTLNVNGAQTVVWVNEIDLSAQNRLLGSLVRVSGVCSPVLNNRKQRMGVRLLVPSAECVEMVEASPENLFDLQARSIGSLMQPGSSRGGAGVQLVKVTGVVTYNELRWLFLQNGDDGLRVLTREDVLVKPGDCVEVVGFAQMDGLSPKLVQALVRKTGDGPLPAATPIDLLGLDSENDRASRDATRGFAEATVLGYSFNDSAQVLQLKQENTGKTFYAYLSRANDAQASVPVGSRVKLEGPFKAKTDSVPDFGQVITSFEMYLNSTADIQVVARPSWWTGGHTLWVVGGLGTVLFVSLGWISALRRQVRLQTQALQQENAERKQAQAKLADANAALQKENLQRKQAEDVLRYQEERTRLIIDQAFDAVVTADDDFRVIDWNRAAEKMLGWSRPEILGLNLLDTIVSPSRREERTSELEQFRSTGEWKGFNCLIQTTAICRDGRELPVDLTITPVRLGTSCIFTLFLRDITERKQAEADLAYERHLLESLLQNSADYIYFKDRGSRFLRCSKLVGQRCAGGMAEIIGKTDFDLFIEEHARPAFEDEQEIIRSGRALIGKVEKEIAKDGRESWALTSKMPLRNQNGEIVGTFGISKDITAIKQAEAELERAHKELVQASRMAGMAEVATSVLHNVGNVLNSINVSAAMMDDRVKQSSVLDVRRLAKLLEEHAEDRVAFVTTDPKGKMVLDFIGPLAGKLDSEQEFMLEEMSSLRRNVEHVKEIIAMQQSYARVSGVFENISVTDLLEDSLRIDAGSLARHDIEVVREFSVLPPICTDKHKVLQILINLVRNAKYACDESGRNDKQMILRATNGEGRVKIAVIDNGVGIPPGNLTRIFNHGFTTRKDGHGFGLHSGALAARELGGSLSAYSKGQGLGAVFTLELPCEPQAETKSRASSL